MKFYLGTHEVSWLGRVSDVPLFVSHRRFQRQKTYPVATTSWALDSGGFTELSLYHKWTTSEVDYIDAVERYVAEVGRMDWASPQDWMCEPWIIDKTGLSVREHQERTVGNYLSLTDQAPHLPFIPVLQGWEMDDYFRCVEMYLDAGVDLASVPVVGVGSVCRRQGSGQIADILGELRSLGLKLHGYGVKKKGLELSARHLSSSDSMAWSYRARMDARGGVQPTDCTHASCANCMKYALKWREEVLTSIDSGLE